jgi:hypothetical protein
MSNSLFESKLAIGFSCNRIVESEHAVVVKVSQRVGFDEMVEVYPLDHLLELPTCLSPFHLAIRRRVPFVPPLVLERSK